MIKTQPALNAREEYVSYDVVSLFTNIPVHETVEYIIDEIYEKKKLPQITENRDMFRKLLLRLTTENTFMFNDCFYKQIYGCTMGDHFQLFCSTFS